MDGYLLDIYPIIAGKAGGSYPGEVYLNFYTEIREKLEPKLCCDLSIAIVEGDDLSILKMIGTAK